MLTSQNLIEGKYKEILEYQDVITNAAVDRITTPTIGAELGYLAAALVTSFLMVWFTRAFTPSLEHKSPPQQ